MRRPSRKEARAERKARQEADRRAKSARLAATVTAPAPRLGADPESIFQMNVVWIEGGADQDGEWSSGTPRAWCRVEWAEHVAPKAEEWTRLTWSEIHQLSSESGHRMHHFHDTADIIDEAQVRLHEIERYEDRVFRFRCGGTKRVWGLRYGAEFHVVWYDPEHEIYPVD